MKRTITAASVALALALLGGEMHSPTNVSACSLVGLSSRHLPELVEGSPIIAIGTWVETGEFEATFVVDESLKGTEDGATHKFDNRQTYTHMACSPYDEEFHAGFRFKDGQHSLVFMEKQVDGLWQVGWSSHAAFDLPVDDLAPMPMWPGQGDPVTLAEMRATIVSAIPVPGVDLDALEVTIGCKAPQVFNAGDILNYRLLGTSGIALVTVLESPSVTSAATTEQVTARVDEVIQGDLRLAATITMNDRWISDYATGDCEPQMESSRRGLREGVQYLVFLRPDEFGVATFRPAAWGQAVVSVNETYITGDHPTLAEIRALTGVPQLAPAELTPTVPEAGKDLFEAAVNPARSGDGGSDNSTWLALLAVVMVATAALAAALLVMCSRKPSS